MTAMEDGAGFRAFFEDSHWQVLHSPERGAIRTPKNSGPPRLAPYFSMTWRPRCPARIDTEWSLDPIFLFSRQPTLLRELPGRLPSRKRNVSVSKRDLSAQRSNGGVMGTFVRVRWPANPQCARRSGQNILLRQFWAQR